MKGYFKQLAHHTGLSFESGQTAVAHNSFKSQANAAEHTGRAQHVSPLHVEEVSFAAPPQPAAHEAVKDNAGRADASLSGYGAESSKAVEAGMSILQAGEAGGGKESATENFSQAQAEIPHGTFPEESQIRYTQRASPQENAEGKEIHAGERRAHQLFEGRSVFVQNTGPLELSERMEISGNAFAEQSKEPREQPLTKLQSHAIKAQDAEQQRQPLDVDEQEAREWLEVEHERDATTKNYLKEVLEWVAAPPSIDESDFEQPRRMDARLPENDFALDDETEAAAIARHDSAREPEVQDLNLSIGTISIVIEDPQRETPALPAPAPRVESAPTRATTEPTSLSRYYLRSF